MNTDSMTIEILPDGTLKITTDKISAPNHANAEQFLRDTAKLMGGPVTQRKRTAQSFTTVTQQQKAKA